MTLDEPTTSLWKWRHEGGQRGAQPCGWPSVKISEDRICVISLEMTVTWKHGCYNRIECWGRLVIDTRRGQTTM